MRHKGHVTPAPLGLVQTGPLVQVTLSPPTSGPVPISAVGLFVPAKLMVDTGAQMTVVEQSLAQQLGLPPIRFTPMVGVSQVPEMCPVYRMGITLGMDDESGGIAQVTFVADVIGMKSPQAPQQHAGLLGRDFLKHFRLIYDGPSGTFEIISRTQQLVAPGPEQEPPTPIVDRAQLKAKRKAQRAARKKNRRP